MDHFMSELYREKLGFKMGVLLALALRQHLQHLKLATDVKTRVEGLVLICVLKVFQQVE